MLARLYLLDIGRAFWVRNEGFGCPFCDAVYRHVIIQTLSTIAFPQSHDSVCSGQNHAMRIVEGDLIVTMNRNRSCDGRNGTGDETTM